MRVSPRGYELAGECRLKNSQLEDYHVENPQLALEPRGKISHNDASNESNRPQTPGPST
jgi:hypothetical protein